MFSSIWAREWTRDGIDNRCEARAEPETSIGLGRKLQLPLMQAKLAAILVFVENSICESRHSNFVVLAGLPAMVTLHRLIHKLHDVQVQLVMYAVFIP
mmetsp:Transcript_84207/g.154417  ORF Transcript_84207/g.154417 Transcript_84207/m.154417 type:complete len:98 (+) Transcript_84207:156-449(+)